MNTYLLHLNYFRKRVLTTPTGVKLGEKHVVVGVFPASIAPEKFESCLQEPEVQDRIAELEREYRGVKLILSIDRLDYIKGIPEKLLAFEAFLEQHEEWVGKVVLYQVAVPIRTEIKEYQDLRAYVFELFYRINEKFRKLIVGDIRKHNILTKLYKEK